MMNKTQNSRYDLFSMVDDTYIESEKETNNGKLIEYRNETKPSEEKVFENYSHYNIPDEHCCNDIEKTQHYEMYSIEEVRKAATEYFGGDQLAGDVWMNKYALKDSEGNIYEKTPDDMHHRIAKEIARIEKRYPNPMSEEDIFEVLKGFKYIVPQGSPMAGIGNNFQISSLSNCFVIGTKGSSDSYGAIMKIDQEQVQLMKRRGGVGHDLSHIRPSGSAVKNCALTSTGVVPFMERHSNSTK